MDFLPSGRPFSLIIGYADVACTSPSYYLFLLLTKRLCASSGMQSRYAGARPLASTLLVCALVATLFGCLQAVIIPGISCPHGNNWVQVVSFNVIPSEEIARNNSGYDGVTYAAESTFFNPLPPSTWSLALLHLRFELLLRSSAFLYGHLMGYDGRWWRKTGLAPNSRGRSTLSFGPLKRRFLPFPLSALVPFL